MKKLITLFAALCIVVTGAFSQTTIGAGTLKGSVVGNEKIPVSGSGHPVINGNLLHTYHKARFDSLYGRGFLIQSSAPLNHASVWVDSGNAFVGMYPIRKYVNGAWEPVNPNMDFYDPIGQITSRGRPLIVIGWGQSNYATSFNRDYIGTKSTGYLATSSTSLNTATIVVGTSVTAVTNTGLSYIIGDYVNFNSSGTPNEFMWGNVTAYNSVSGSITFTVIVGPIAASSYTDWVVTRQLPGDIEKDYRITIWNADDNVWEVPDIRNQLPSGTGTANNWSWNLNLHGANSIQIFAKEFIKATGRAVRIVQWREGGTPLAYWEPGATGGFPGWVALNATVIESGIPKADLVIGVHGEGGLDGSPYFSQYATYYESLYKGIITSIRGAVYGSPETAFIMPSTAVGITEGPLTVEGSDQAEYAIRSLSDGSNKYNAWGQGNHVKAARYTSIPLPSATSINLASVADPFTVTIATGLSTPASPVWLFSRADNSNKILANVTSYNSGTGALVLNTPTVWGTGTHTDWDVNAQDVLHKSIGDNIADGQALFHAYDNLIKNYKKKVYEAQENYTFGTGTSTFQVGSTGTDNFIFTQRVVNTMLKTFKLGSRSHAVLQSTGGDDDTNLIFRFANGATPTSADNNITWSSYGQLFHKPVYFSYVLGSPTGSSRIENGTGTGHQGLRFVAATSGFTDAIFEWQHGSTLVASLYEGAGNGAELSMAAHLKLNTAGNGIQIKGGTNATIGTATANGSTEVTVTTTKVTANSIIIIMCQSGCGATSGPYYISARTPGTSFGFKSTVGDTGTVGWWILEKN